MIRLRARWVLPVSAPPIDGGEVSVEGGTIRHVGRAARGKRGGPVVDIGDSILFPAPVNAHTHLEWSHLESGAAKGPPFTGWVRSLLASPEPSAEESSRATERSARVVASGGVRLVGNFSSRLSDVRTMRAAGLGGIVFHELIGLSSSRTSSLLSGSTRALERAGLARPMPGRGAAAPLSSFPAPHGPHTVSRELLRRLATRHRRGRGRLAIHAAESAEEVEFLRTGGGAFREIHEQRGGWDGRWSPPNESPIRYLDSLGLLTPRTVLVHCVHVDETEIGLLASRGVSVVVCPRSNQWTGAGTAPVAGMIEAGVSCGLGTDSLASNNDLDMAAELASARRMWPDLPAGSLVTMLTRGGARSLGFDRRRGGAGVLAAGARAWMAAAAIPPGTPAGADPCAILCGDFGAVLFRRIDARHSP